jgi:FAD/FMN-containing dehydrogenase
MVSTFAGGAGCFGDGRQPPTLAAAVAASVLPTWLKDYWATLEPHTHGFYTNDVSTDSAEQVHANYQGNYPRLVQLKNKYDPTNLFRLNANVQPTV